MATNTAASFTNHTGNGTAGPFSISFSYLSEAEVDVTVGGVLKTITTHYTFTSADQITFTSGNEPGNGVAIKFQRNTNVSSKAVDFVDGSVLTEIDLDNQSDQLLFSMQEIVDSGAGSNVQSVSGTTPIVSSGGVTPAISISAATTSAAGSMSASDKSKLDGIETSATADQTAAEIRTLVESASDSNVFTDADHTKLDGIEASATADQTASEIKTAYEGNSDTNAFTDAEKTKLSGVESNATADQTNAEIKTAYEANSDTNVFTDAEKTKLSGVETSADVTDATNVNAAGAVMNSDLDGKGEILVGDGSGDPTALAVGSNGYVLKANSSTATGLEWSAAGSGEVNQNAFSTIAVSGQSDVAADSATDTLNIAAGSNVTVTTNAGSDTVTISSTDTNTTYSVGDGGLTQNNFTDALKTKLDGIAASANVGLTDIVGDTTPQLGGNLDVQASEITTSTSNGNIKLNPNGTGVVEVKGDGSSADGTIQLNCSQNSHGIKLKSPPHSAGASYTLTFPNTDGNADQVLKTDGSGGLDWVDQASGGATDKISEGNTEAETVDTGSDGHFKVTTEGTERLRVIADGKVGIGTSTPGELLQVYDASGNPTIHIRANNQNTASFKLENDDGNWTISSGTANYPLNFAVGGSNKLTILNDGKVGIGTTSPSTVLEVNGTFKAGGLAYPSSDGSANQVLKTDGSGTLSFVDQSGGGGGLTSDSQYNTVGGTNAGDSFSGTDAVSNTLIGYNVGTAITTGDRNTALGSFALMSNTTASDNIAVGANCLVLNSTGASNTAVGKNALYANTTADNNTAVGFQALQANTTGTKNLAFGAYALDANTTANKNLAFGYAALTANTTGQENVAIGSSCLKANTTASSNIGIGESALKISTTAHQLVAIGSEAGDTVTTGHNLIMIGYNSQPSSATATDEITLGDTNITKFRIPGLNSFEINDSGQFSGVASTASGTAGVRKIYASTSSPSGGADGDIWIKHAS